MLQDMQWLNLFTQYLDANRWVIEVFIVVFVTMMVDFISRKFLNRIEVKVRESKNKFDDLILDSSRKPLRLLIWVTGIFWAADIARLESEVSLLSAIEPLREVATITIISWFLVGVARESEKMLIDPKKTSKPMDQTTASAIGKLVRASIIITAVLVGLQSLGFSISGVLAFGGIGGIAVGFAAKDLLANFFGGLMIYLDRPFKVGDWIKSPDQEIEGTVEHIGWRQTRIMTFDKRPLYVPNSTFSTISVQNPSRMSHRRIYETIGVRYCDSKSLKAIVEDVKTMLRNHEEIDQSQTMIVNVNEFAASSIDFFVYTFTKTTNWVRYHEIKQDVLFKILEIIENNNADVAFPTQTLHLEQEN